MLGLISVAVPLMTALATPVASLRMESGESAFSVIVSEDQSNGYQIQFDCVRTCSHFTSLREPIGDTPLGLFTRD